MIKYLIFHIKQNNHLQYINSNRNFTVLMPIIKRNQKDNYNNGEHIDKFKINVKNNYINVSIKENIPMPKLLLPLKKYNAYNNLNINTNNK